MTGVPSVAGAAAESMAASSGLVVDLAGTGGILERHLETVADAIDDLGPLDAGQADGHRLLLEVALPGLGDVVLLRFRLARGLLAGLRLVEGALEDVDDLAPLLLEDRLDRDRERLLDAIPLDLDVGRHAGAELGDLVLE